MKLIVLVQSLMLTSSTFALAQDRAPVIGNANQLAPSNAVSQAGSELPAGWGARPPASSALSSPLYGWSGSPYDPSAEAASHGASQIVDGVQIIPNAPGWNPNAPELVEIYAGIRRTWELLNAKQAAQTYWQNSAYNPANQAAGAGASHTSDGVQLIPGAPGWNPDAPQLQPLYSNMRDTWVRAMPSSH